MKLTPNPHEAWAEAEGLLKMTDDEKKRVDAGLKRISPKVTDEMCEAATEAWWQCDMRSVHEIHRKTVRAMLEAALKVANE